MKEHASSEGGSSCSIQREGHVISVESDGVLAEINGKTLRIAKEKVTEDVQAGDAIIWTGKIWRASNGGDTGTSNMRKA
ncbi:hypothetical protein [Paenibacillus sacheonensis]|uniref:Uncharacterized protein n=1 Tax=Paenibacillus sacheonensis TaxID=742054 RepID=A0A7X5BX31_9BACL|nr:hypothetical protein [Paenibacillus sacheonensis]MBM7563280.1 hypothetical protein [Paenibacillus sacheonensis]NBC68162.1 hypothetical protein [Paenibacillus sacheonensis]